MTSLTRRDVARLGVAALLLAAVPAAQAQTKDQPMTLFKIITVKDEIVIGLSESELAQIGGGDAGSVARALAGRGELTVWRYAVRKNAGGELAQAPLARVGLIAHSSLRVEPYATPLKVIPPQ
ncbi:MAG: hypothetical protein M5U07_10160 [Xanthobacteraceae bacterium]|nr:hypothetical protein [Xanthobacteraceae bacterium]